MLPMWNYQYKHYGTTILLCFASAFPFPELFQVDAVFLFLRQLEGTLIVSVGA